MSRSCTLLFGILLIPSLARASTIKLDFEGFPDGTILTKQYSGFNFNNTVVLTAGISLNDLEFPPRSGFNVAADLGGPVTISFSTPLLTFSGFFTYSSTLTLEAFNSMNQAVATASSAFPSNFVSSGNPPNETLQLQSAGGISRITITGAATGASFAFDDITGTTRMNAIPEPASRLLLSSGLLFGFAVTVVRRRMQR